MYLLPSVKMEMNAPINPQLCDLSCTLSGNLDPLPDEWKIFPWSRFPGYTISERAGRQTSWVWEYGFDIQPSDSPTKRKWVSVASGKQSQRCQTSLLLAPRISKTIYSKSTALSIRTQRNLSLPSNPVTAFFIKLKRKLLNKVFK
jgi:hypothetical protein